MLAPHFAKSPLIPIPGSRGFWNAQIFFAKWKPLALQRSFFAFQFIVFRRFIRYAHVAQSVEHVLGKDEVTGSIPVMGSIGSSRISQATELLLNQKQTISQRTQNNKPQTNTKNKWLKKHSKEQNPT